MVKMYLLYFIGESCISWCVWKLVIIFSQRIYNDQQAVFSTLIGFYGRSGLLARPRAPGILLSFSLIFMAHSCFIPRAYSSRCRVYNVRAIYIHNLSSCYSI